MGNHIRLAVQAESPGSGAFEEELRRRADDVARSLDLEDGSAVIKAKLGTIEITWTVDRGLTKPSYHATFYETR